jgi:hypothetical protein
MDALPLWGVFAVTVALSLAAAEVGYLAGGVMRRRTPGDDGEGIGHMVGGILGLLAFLLAFVTSMQMDRFDTRRAMVVQEANAIGTTYLRAGYLPEPYRADVRGLLGQYVDLRLQIVDPAKLDRAQTESQAVTDQLWPKAEALAKDNWQSEMVSLFVDSLNNMIDVQTSRVAAVRASQLPTAVWWLIYALAVLTMVIVGLASGMRGRRNLIALFLLVLAFSGVVRLIADLERPQQGALEVSQQALLDVQKQIRSGGP